MAFRTIADRLTPEQFNRAVTTAPGVALHFTARRLTDDQFNEAVTAEPATALILFAGRLTPEQFAKAVQAEPSTALDYAGHRLSEAQRDWCATCEKQGPQHAGPFPDTQTAPQPPRRIPGAGPHPGTGRDAGTYRR